MIKYKCEWYGKKFIQISKWFPSSKICSQCGYYYKDLGDKKEWTCPHCQTHHDRDINAAKNIKKEGLRLLMDETFVNLRNWGDSTVILLSWESTGPWSKNPRHLYVEVVQSLLSYLFKFEQIRYENIQSKPFKSKQCMNIVIICK